MNRPAAHRGDERPFSSSNELATPVLPLYGASCTVLYLHWYVQTDRVRLSDRTYQDYRGQALCHLADCEGYAGLLVA